MSIVSTPAPGRNNDSTPRGGQATLTIYGQYASFYADEPAPAPAKPAAHRGDDQPRRVGGLTYRQRRASIFRGCPESVVLAMQKAQDELAAKQAQAASAPAPATVAQPAPAEQTPAAKAAAVFLAVCKARPLVAGFSVEQFNEWLDENWAETMAHQARMAELAADEYEGAGLATATNAQRAAAHAADARDLAEWREQAELADEARECSHSAVAMD